MRQQFLKHGLAVLAAGVAATGVWPVADAAAESPDARRTAVAEERAERDRILADRITRRLSSEQRLRMIDVGAQAGAVTLRGSVASSADKQRASELARSVSGVKAVANRVEVGALPAVSSGPPRLHRSR